MSNIKSIKVTGSLPFNADEFYPDIDKLYAQLNRPVFGLRIRWTGKNATVSNETLDANTPYKGGITTVCGFEIEGTEAVSWEWIAWMENVIRSAKGTIEIRKLIDLEG